MSYIMKAHYGVINVCKARRCERVFFSRGEVIEIYTFTVQNILVNVCGLVDER